MNASVTCKPTLSSAWAVALLLPLAAVRAAAQTPAAAPVTVNSCGPVLNKAQNLSLTDILASQSAGIAIEFVNDSTKTADLINFAVDSNGTQFVIRDVGTFSPNVSIKHTYRNGAGQAFILPAFIAPNVACTVSSVKFADGSIWRKGDATAGSAMAPATARAVLAANPTQLEIDRATESELFLVSSSKRVTAFRESDDCSGIATISVAATGQSSATYSVKPLAAGSCTARATDEAGSTIAIPILVR